MCTFIDIYCKQLNPHLNYSRDKVHITGSLIYRQIQLPGKGDDQQTTSIASIVAGIVWLIN